MTPFIGPCTSALAIAWSLTLNTSLRDCLSHHEVWIISCQWGSFAALFHQAVAPLIPKEFRAAMSLFLMSFLSSSDKAVQSAMARSITRLWPTRKGCGIQVVAEIVLPSSVLNGCWCDFCWQWRSPQDFYSDAPSIFHCNCAKDDAYTQCCPAHFADDFSDVGFVHPQLKDDHLFSLNHMYSYFFRTIHKCLRDRFQEFFFLHKMSPSSPEGSASIAKRAFSMRSISRRTVSLLSA